MNKIWKLVLNDFLSTTAIQAFDIYTIWYIAHITGNQHLIALFGSVGIFDILLSPIGGIFSDNYSKEQIIKVISYIRSVLFVGLFIIVLATKNVDFNVILISGLLSILSAFYTPATESIIPELSIDENELFVNNTYLNLAGQLAAVAGAGIGSLLILIFKPSIVYLIIAFLVLLSSLFVVKFFEKSVQGKINSFSIRDLLKKESRQKISFNLKSIWKFPVIKVLFPYACVINLSYWMFYYLMPIYLGQEFKKIKFAYSIQELTIAIAALICGILLSKFSDYFIKKAKLYTSYLIAQSVGIVMMPLIFIFLENEFEKLIILISAWLIYGIFNFLSSLILITKIQQLVDRAKLGTTLGIVFSAFGALNPIAAGLSGLIHHINSITVFAVGSIMLFVSVIMLFDKRINQVLSIAN
ncbi:MFS transporter [Ligilactobacillus cholophilus]|uniref:MFS transporter n=1 Tax=Ligilactobacillus cholophilus TaxID=3050131 RepID=UPI0025B02094|nr:MFS transporter [Ligilactobacillus cholophilus]